LEKLKIGSISVERTSCLAPMAGVSDRAFRELCSGFGASMTVSEMVSAKALTFGDEKSKQLLKRIKSDVPQGVQLFGADPKTMAEASKLAMEFLPDFIDINFGCPAPKITKSGSGSALLKSPENIEKIVYAVKSSVGVPVTAKIRTGWSDASRVLDCAKACESGGTDAITVHGRTREQMYSPPVDLKSIELVKKNLKIPVIGNGNIYSASDAGKMYTETGCDLVMVARGALGNPWLFYQISSLKKNGYSFPDPPVSEKMRIMIEHVKKIIEYKGEKRGINEARKHALWYTKGLRGSAEYRRKMSEMNSIEELEEIAYKIMTENS